MSMCGGCHGVGCSNSAVDNFDFDTADEDSNIFAVFEDYIVWSYQTFLKIIPLWTAIFKEPFLFLENNSIFLKLFELKFRKLSNRILDLFISW